LSRIKYAKDHQKTALIGVLLFCRKADISDNLELSGMSAFSRHREDAAGTRDKKAGHLKLAPSQSSLTADLTD
jgi:hypothetical protein